MHVQDSHKTIVDKSHQESAIRVMAGPHRQRSKETMKGHGRMTKSGLRSTKAQAENEPEFEDVKNATMNQTHSLTKQKSRSSWFSISATKRSG
jgi:hypothetical protein